MSVTDRDYFKQRAEEERARADSASSGAAAKVHLALAAKYDSLVKKADERPMLHIGWNEDVRRHA